MREITDYNKEELEELYKKFGNLRKLAKHFKKRGTTVAKILKDHGIERNWFPGSPRKYKVNEEFFDEINSVSVYWLGFIAADGFVRDKHYIGIQLAERDRSHLEKFKCEINSEALIRKITCKNSKRNKKYKDSISYSIRICSKKLIQKLSELDIKQNKSLTLRFPKYMIDNKYLNHYLRGYIDGDGGFLFQQGQLCFRVRGTYDYLYNINQIFVAKGIIPNKEKKIPFDNGCYSLRYNGNNICGSIVRYLYENSTEETRLDRKYDIIKSYL